ncbi:MAG TPA: adenylate/guanylate cyclase domain-containing protein [Vicinamibacteria bacterium]
MATGEAVAGKLGTAGQFKIDVFGPVVNLASRLEGITKQLRVPILADENTVSRVKASKAGGDLRFRRLARLRPYRYGPRGDRERAPPERGRGQPPRGRRGRALREGARRFRRRGLEPGVRAAARGPALGSGEGFPHVPILSHRREPPPGWEGVVALESK